MTQPPLSMQIKELEEKLGISLILRNTQKISLTKEGETFYTFAAICLKELCLMVDTLKGKSVNKIVLGMTRTLGFHFIPLFKNFINHFENEIIIYKDNYTSKELMIELQKGNIDFAIGSDFTHEIDIYSHKLIYKEPVVVALPENHEACKMDFVDINDILDLPLYWFNRHQNPVYYEQCEKVFQRLAYPVIRRPELSDTLSMLLDISLGKGMALLPASVAQADMPGVCYKKLKKHYEERLSIVVYLIWRSDSLAKDYSEEIIQYFD